MGSKLSKDKIVLENLDRVIAGEKLKDESDMDKDTRAALELTRELSLWSKSPSKEFKTQLKARLIHQLSEQEKQQPASDDLILRQLLRRPRWQLTVAALILVIIIAIITIIVLWINRVP